MRGWVGRGRQERLVQSQERDRQQRGVALNFQDMQMDASCMEREERSGAQTFGVIDLYLVMGVTGMAQIS